jgi:tRNA 2-selenouridine synthase
LLTEYYDPMYAFQREKKGARIEFAGNRGGIGVFARAR